MKKWMVITAVILAAGIAGYGLMSRGVNADVQKAVKGEIKQYLEETAEVSDREKQTIYIEGTGKILDILAESGQAVKKGDLLLRLDKTDLEQQLRDAETKITLASSQLKGTDINNYANRIEIAKVAVQQAQIAHTAAKRNFDSAKNLFQTGSLSKEEYDRAQDAYKAAVTALESAKLQLSDAEQGAPEHIKSGYKAQLEQALINKDIIIKNLEKQEVRAPLDGVILEKLVEINAPAAPQTAAFIIGNLTGLELSADILADDAGKIQLGNEVEISGKSINDTVLKGKVIKIAPGAKTVTSILGVNQKRVPVTIEILEESPLIKPGYNLDVKIITSVKSDVVLVPDSAVFEYKGKDSVFVVINGRAQIRAVKKGIESSKMIEITEGLKEGETILTKPDNSIKEGANIKFREV